MRWPPTPRHPQINWWQRCLECGDASNVVEGQHKLTNKVAPARKVPHLNPDAHMRNRCNFRQSFNRCDRQGTLHHSHHFWTTTKACTHSYARPAYTNMQGHLRGSIGSGGDKAGSHTWDSFSTATTIQLQISRQQNKSQYRTPVTMPPILSSHRRSSVQETPPSVLDKCGPLSQRITNCRTSARLDKRCTTSQVWA